MQVLIQVVHDYFVTGVGLLLYEHIIVLVLAWVTLFQVMDSYSVHVFVSGSGWLLCTLLCFR